MSLKTKDENYNTICKFLSYIASIVADPGDRAKLPCKNNHKTMTAEHRCLYITFLAPSPPAPTSPKFLDPLLTIHV